MQLRTLTLHNFKTHHDLTLTFGPGVTGIVGKNGKGKSSVIEAIDFLFTGYTVTDQKASMIRLGATEGWVSGTFELNGQEGYLERHLSESKVVLRYGGKTYKKATEVQQLWNKLLQIDPVIFHNVIIAGQGDIPLLFCGDQSVREKIFQRIFMVPPTEKIRTVMWDRFIKQAPAERHVEDESVLEAQEATLAAAKNATDREIDQLLPHVLDAPALHSVRGRISYLDKCIKDAVTRPALLARERELVDELAGIIQAREQLEVVDVTGLQGLRDKLIKLSLAQRSYSNRLKLQQQLDQLNCPDDLDQQIGAAKLHLQECEVSNTQCQAAKLGVETRLADLSARMKKLAALLTVENCPTCNQPLHDVNESRKLLEADYQAAQTAMAEQVTAGVTRRNAWLAAKQAVDDLLSLKMKSSTLKIQLADLPASFDPAELTTTQTEINKLEALVKEQQQLELKQARLETTIAQVRGQLDNLSVYDEAGTPEEELTLMHQVVAENTKRQEEINQLRVVSGQQAREIELLETRLKDSIENRKYNEQRKTYLDSLQNVYELLSSSVFPRLLVESYGEYVEKYLQANLENFSIPYTAKIRPGFKIDMLDTDGRTLPVLSGGQKVVVGLCLRLALHRLFAQSFPMWLVDEGTTHLDDENRKLYFQLIDQLKKDNILKQIIIIDHDAQLSSVVDNVITLPLCTN